MQINVGAKKLYAQLARTWDKWRYGPEIFTQVVGILELVMMLYLHVLSQCKNEVEIDMNPKITNLIFPRVKNFPLASSTFYLISLLLIPCRRGLQAAWCSGLSRDRLVWK